MNHDKHGDSWKHRCPVLSCSYSSFTRPDFKQHIKTHNKSELRVKKCGWSRCNNIFMKSSDYIEHQQLKHGMLLNKAPPILA